MIDKTKNRKGCKTFGETLQRRILNNPSHAFVLELRHKLTERHDHHKNSRLFFHNTQSLITPFVHDIFNYLISLPVTYLLVQ